ncbi:hypothetical protein P43SY_005382 [Pythium insidiosum]|uniref:tryptophan--tRNA ligase n=1 Tax=Pythium insidiosum TaxID=114742 RepID=A0AAD5LFT1_PYTIN|nr:hypothetical protein P43SY_005382 [Pythium insidiosum]
MDDREFDVRRFLLDQKSGANAQALHQTSLFRPRGVLDREDAPPSRGSSRHSASRLQSSASADALGTTRRPPTRQRTPLGNQAQQGAREPEENAEMTSATHFYTLEKVAESAFHAVQSKNRTWQFLPGAEERSKSSSGSSANASSGGANSLSNVERPSRRVDVLDLDRCLETALRYVQQKRGKQHQRGIDVLNTATAMALIDRDFMTLQVKVAQRYGSTLEYASSASTAGGVTAAPATDDGAQNELACLLFEQKWSDIVLGELEAMLTTSFLEQGVLLRKTRIRYAKTFSQLEKLFEKQSMRLRDTLSTLEATRKELADTSDHHAQDSIQMRIHYEEEMKRITSDFEQRNAVLEQKLAEAQEQMGKMGDTMRTLNTVFRQMREDTEKVKAVELRENYIKLERRYDASREEVERLRPLVALSERLQQEKEAIERENESLQERIASFDSVVAAKDEVIANLMEQQSELLAAQELRAARDEEVRRRAAEEAEEDEDGDEGEGDEENNEEINEEGTVSSQDVAQLEALHILFLERLEKLKDDLRDQPNSTRAAINTITQLASMRRISMDTSGAVVLDENTMEALVNSHTVLVNETWKMFRQLIHAITVPFDPTRMPAQVRSTVATLLAAGLDPKRNVLFKQSDVSFHNELAWYLSCITPIGWLNRMTQFKQKQQQQKMESSLGLLAYPVLMAADILVYKATHIPVGEDQTQHLELARDVASTFNDRFQRDVFPRPSPVENDKQSSLYRIMSLRHPTNKMSKSDATANGRIDLTDSPEMIRKKIMSATTDSIDGISYDKTERPGVSNLLSILSAVTDQTMDQLVAEHANRRTGEFKKIVADAVIAKICPIGDRIRQYEADEAYLDQVLEEGADRARELAGETMKEVKQAMGL